VNPTVPETKTNKPASGTITAYLGPDVSIEGILRFEHSVLIEGKFKGEIQSNGQLVIGESAEVEADIQSRQITIKGTVKGTVKATERLQIQGKAEVSGDLTTPSLQMDETVTFEGKCSMTPNSGNNNQRREQERAENDKKQILEAVGSIKA